MNKRMRNNTKKAWILLASAVLVLTMAVGGTMAYLFTSTEPVENVFTYGTIDTSIPEDFDGETKSNVRIQNTGTVDAYVRTQIVVTWKNAAGEVSGTPVNPEDYTMILGDGWFAKDGFYYCRQPVKAGEESAVLITKATKASTAPEGYDLSIEILAQSVQAEPAAAAEEIWPVTVTDGELTAEGGAN